MASYRLPSSYVNLPKRSVPELKNNLGIESSTRFLVPVVSNTILIKNCQAKVLGDAFTPCSEMSEDVSFDIPYHDITKMLHPDVADGNDNLHRIESEMIDADYYYTSDSSSRSSNREESKHDDKVISTIRLLEEVNYRILGDKNPSLPKVEKVEILASETDLPIDEEEGSEEGEATLEEEEIEEFNRDPEYMDYVKYAKKLVDGVLQSAKDVYKREYDKKIVSVTFAEYQEKDDIIWPTIHQFHVRMGVVAIDRYIKHAFVLAEAWKYKIKHLISQSDEVSDFYLYDAKFCIPTFCYPIAQATVSVFFTIEVSRVVPKHLPVRVSFTLESLRSVMVPGETVVNDDMLLRVLYAKLMVFKSIRF